MKQKQIFEITDKAAKQISKASEASDSKGWPLSARLEKSNIGGQSEGFCN